MRYKLLGNSGLRVSELCLGTMTFGSDMSWCASKEESQKIFETFAEAGGNFIDTANNYTDGQSEQYLGEFLVSDRERFVLGTKYSLSMRPNDANASGNHRKNMVQALEASLKRLNTDYIDLFWVHAWDFTTPVEEVMRGLDDMVRAGKVLYVGISDTPAWVVSQANTLASLRGWTSFVGLQLRYSLVDRSPERDLLPMARTFDIGVTAWSALGAGLLSGKYNTQNAPSEESRRLGDNDPRLNKHNLSIAEEVQKIAHEMGQTPSQVGLNWLRQQAGIVIPILGARKASQLQENLGCLDFSLDQEALQRLDEVSKIELGFPHDFLASPGFSKRLYGDTLPLLENRRKP